ncbi:hypothetical protein DFS34DRAFT_601742 [Phlyctochytrium arcticum]|nr:hypothetical protein DFS34DRAFT_601742 [Phlyctochytrium arcticum]
MAASPSPTDSQMDWITWMLADSALPTGGFVASAGLESAIQTGHVQVNSASSLDRFLASSEQTMMTSLCPYLFQTFNILDQPDCVLQDIVKLDLEVDCCLGSNTVNRRASRAQGIALLSLLLRAFPSEAQPTTSLITSYRSKIRQGLVPGHFIICFGVLCHSLSISKEKSLPLLKFFHLRSILSAAVRLNLLGPYQAQQRLFQMRNGAPVATVKSQVYQTAPVLDIVQMVHERLYSRVFNS